ncbi:PorP/SprF family type IX secretion system membrane protein [Mucilaginibacter sp. UR6-1]|uniref:PorP/SprF family type IX secretion system membrane protein n=1 Tax=Mucilaginibacter sp. UR6-1 TaxID=1435643 RepID=UPI001E2C9C1F|nr:PorP/SprF family type IX secretion system membrane protein [Mucilaginibacter sp. UR6-1]MCC8407931.1 PorP/SprF family type IX secretion system membrane protein [Mucilaginibacter sp. UR6-1]
MKIQSKLLVLVLMLTAMKSLGQDHQYSQFFNAPVYLNPALNGQFEGKLRMSLTYRNQYSTIPGNLNYLSATIDYNIPRFGGGFGLMFTRSSEGTAYLRKNSIMGIYSYSVGSDDYVLSFGLAAGATNRSVDMSKLVFGDQIDPNYGIIPGQQTSADLLAYNSRFYFDSGLGVNLVTGGFMVGAAAFHLNRPNESFTGTPVKLPMRIAAHASYRYDLNKYDNLDDYEKSFVIPSVVFYKQSNINSYSAGVQYKRRSVNAGLWYRGGAGGPSAVVVSFIFDIFKNRESGDKLRVGVSHDVPMSKLSYGGTSGTTEGSVVYETPGNGDSNYKFNGALRCYDFY